jgi:AraC-like DNA-binding protein
VGCLFLIAAKYGEMTYYIQRMLEIRNEYFPNQQVVEQVSKGRKFIDENCCEPLDLLTISRYSFLSKFHFTRLFKRCYGRTPHQYLTDKRMELAKQLLLSNYNVMDVCYLIGFDSPNSFSTLFKKYTGTSPRDFKKKQFSIGLKNGFPPNLFFKIT